MRQKKGQDLTQQLNFNVNVNQQRYEQLDYNQQNYQALKNSQRLSDFSHQQNETNRMQHSQSYYKNEGPLSMITSSQFSQPFVSDQQLAYQKPSAIQGRKIDSQQQVQVSFRQSLNPQPNMFFQNQQVAMQFNPIQLREKGFQNPVCQSSIQTQVIQTNNNSQYSGSSNSSSIQMKKKYSYGKEDQQILATNNQVINIDQQQQNHQNFQKKKRPTSSLNQNQLKTIYEDIKKTAARKPRSASNTPQKDRSYREKSSRSASKKKHEEKSQKKLSQTLEIKTGNKINNENQENEAVRNENNSDKNLMQQTSARRKKKSSNSLHIKPVSKLNEPFQPQQNSNSKSKSPGKVGKHSLHNGVQHNMSNGKVLGEKNFNSPQKAGKGVSTTKSPEDKQKKKKKTSVSKSKSKPRLNHAKSTSQLLVSHHQQQSHSQSIQNEIPKHQTISTQNLKEIDSFIKKNAQKIQFEQFMKKQEEIEEKLKNKQEEEKRKIQNEQIRKENLVKFCKLKKANENIQNNQNIHMNSIQIQQKYAWGTNQQRIKMHSIIQNQLFSQQQQPQPHQQSIERQLFNNTYAFQKGQFQNMEDDLLEKEKKRRQQSGLSFLNNFNEQIIKKKVEYEKSKQEQIAKSDLNDDISKKKIVAPLNHEEIKKFMILKKRRLENENKKRQEQQKERQERLKNNLHILDQEIKNQRQNNSCQVQLQQDKDKHPINMNNQNPQRSKSSQRKKKNRTVSTPNLERFFNKTQNFNLGINNQEHFLSKDLSHKQLVINYNQLDNYVPNGNAQEYEEEMFLQNNYFSNTQQQYAKKYDQNNKQNFVQNYQISSNNNAGNSTDINEENFDLLNMEFKKMFNLSGNNDNKLMEFSHSINKTQQLTTQGQSNNTHHRQGSSGKKSKTKQMDFVKPKSISMHASSSVGNLKLAQGFDSSHFGNIQNMNTQFMKMKENSKERNSKKARKSQGTSISPEPKILKKSSSTVFKNVPQQSGLDNAKKLSMQQKIEGQDQLIQASKDKYIQELINQKKDELKNMYNQINARMSLIKHNVNVNENQQRQNNQNDVNLDDNEDQELYEQKYFNQPLNNKRIQQAIQQQQVNSNSLGSVNSSQRRVHISNASPIKEEPEEEDKGHFSNLPLQQNNQKSSSTNYVNSFQQIFQNNKKDFINTDSSNQTNSNYPHAINSNPNSDSLRANQNLKEIQQANFKKQNLKDSNNIQSNPSSQQSNLNISPIQQGSVHIPINQIQNNSRQSMNSQGKVTPSKSLSGFSAIESKKDLPLKQTNENSNKMLAPSNTQQILNIPNQYNMNEQQSSQMYSRNESQIIPADPNAPVSLNLKETVQSKSYLSTKNDNRGSQIAQQDIEQSDIENGVLSSKDLQVQQNDEMPILPLNINLQHRVQQMKKRTHNTDNEESQDSTLRNKAGFTPGQDSSNQQMQTNTQKDKNSNGVQVPITSKTPQSSYREENDSRNQIQNAQKDYTQFEQQEEIKLELIKEIETQNQMSSSNFESQVFQKNFNNTNPSLQPINQQKVPQHTPSEIIQNTNQSEDGEEIDVDYLYDLDYDQLQELKVIIFQSDPENPEIQALSEQLILYDAAATIIQKVFRGYYTRKCIAAIIEYQRQQDEEEELLYQQAEKFLEENQIEPEELLEGNPIPLILQQNQQNIPYYSSDQLKEYENREIQFNKNDNSQKQQDSNHNNIISEHEFPIKINDYQNSNNKEDNTFNRESQGNHPFFTSLSIPEQSVNNDLYHPKNYNDDLIQPKQSDFMPDFDFYDKTEKSNLNSAEQQKSMSSGINQISDQKGLNPFAQQPKQNENESIESGKQNINIKSGFSVNQPSLAQKNKFIEGIGNQNYRDTSFNQLNMKEINDQSKSLVTVKEFDTSSKDNYKGVDSVVSQNNQELGKNIFSPNNQSHIQLEISKLQEQAKMWNQMINQIVQLPDNQSQQFKNDALRILNDLQKQSEMSKQILIENIKLNQQILKSPIISTDRFPLSEIDNVNDKQNCSNIKSGEIAQLNEKEINSTAFNKQSNQNNQQSQINQKQNQPQSEDKKVQNQSGQTSKKNLQLDIEEIESNYNIQQRAQKIDKEQKSSDSKPIDQQQQRKSQENDAISQEQRAMARALSVSSIESNELRYVNIVANNSLGVSNKITKSKQSFIDRLNSDHILNSNSNRNSHNGNESVSSVGSSFFEKQPFKEFTSKILQKFTMPQESVEELIKTREEAIEQKHKTQMDLINKMHERNRISPKSFERKQFELEKWVSKERENLKVVKKEIERGWEQFAQTIKQTKRDLEFLEQTKRIDTSKLLQSSEEDQLRRLLSMRSESEHSIEEIGFAERRSIDGAYYKNHQIEDPNKIKIVDNYKPVDSSNLSNNSSSNIRNRNNSDNTSLVASIRSRQASQPNSVNIEDMNQYPESDQMFEAHNINSSNKSSSKYLNVEQQLQLAQKNQEDIQKQQLQKQIDYSKTAEQNKINNQNENKFVNNLDKQARNISSNGSSVYDGEEEIEQFLTAEKNKNEGNIQISQRRAFDMYGYSDDDDYGIGQDVHQNDDNNQNYHDLESDNNDRLDVSPIFTVSSASKQGTQDKESLKYLMNNQGDIAQNMKIESDNKYDKLKQFNKRNSQDSRMSESQPMSPISQSSKKNQDPFQTIEYDDEVNSKKQTLSNKVSPRLGFMRGDLLQEEGIEDKVNYVSDQTLNYLVDDATKDIKTIQDKQQNERDSNQQSNMIQINFLEPIKARQNVYNLDDFPDVREKTSSLESSSGIYKANNILLEPSNIQDKSNQLQNKEEDVPQKQNNNNNINSKQKNFIPSPPNSPSQRETSKNNGDKKVLQNNFLLDLVQNDQKSNNILSENQALSNQNEKEKQDKMTAEDLYLTQNSQQQLQFSENILTTQNTPPGLECATLNFIKDYLVAFSEFIKDNFTDEFLERVNIPLGMDPQEFLKTFTITETIDNSNGEISAAPIYPIVKYIHMQRPVVSEELFAHFNEIFNRERDLSQMTEELFELERFHMRMIFDCFNEALDSMRPFGLRGKPLPWKINSNKLSSIIITPDNIEKILGLAIAKVLKWGSFLCGFIPERIESPTGEIVQIEDEYLNQIKEDRLAQMLENEVIENEDKWLTYEDEETDVQLEIADDIFNYIIEETAMIMHSLQNGQVINSVKNEEQQDLSDGQNIERNFNNNSNNYETLSKNIFGNPNITKGAKRQGLGGGIRPTNDLGISQKQAQEKKQMQKELFLKNLQNSSLNNNQSSQKDQLNSSF